MVWFHHHGIYGTIGRGDMTYGEMHDGGVPQDKPDGSAGGETPQESPIFYESANGSHWREFSDDPMRLQGLAAFWRAARAIVLLPLALLTMIVTLIVFPVLVLFDLRRRENT